MQFSIPVVREEGAGYRRRTLLGGAAWDSDSATMTT